MLLDQVDGRAWHAAAGLFSRVDAVVNVLPVGPDHKICSVPSGKRTTESSCAPGRGVERAAVFALP